MVPEQRFVPLGDGAATALHQSATMFAFLVSQIGVGLTTIVFGVVDQVLLRPLPFPSPHRLVQLESMGESLEPFSQVSSSNWADWRDQSASIAQTRR